MCKRSLLLLLTGAFLLMTLPDGALADRTDNRNPALRSVKMDNEGVLRWEDNGQEVTFFGVNYVAPFSYTYRALGYVQASPEETIRQDVAHLRRMGMNAVRLHVWDNEISDREGNLIENEHLRLLDFLIAQCREQGIHVFLTPIAWLGNGYPEEDQPSPGFSSHARKGDMGTDPATIAAEAHYLEQFVRHVNPFTKIAYKDDPCILGFEFVNEPWSPPADKLTAYVDIMAKAIRRTGCQKPLFYCASQSGYRQHNDALKTSLADGITFGWYPIGLVARRTLKQNFLPTLDDYPLMEDAAFAKKAKIVYEFDAADTRASCLYPAFARAFRQSGIQWATQFAYCPLPLAGSNTPYPTHYLNLLYTPGKAIGMLIATEAFHTLPRGKDYGRYPENTAFGPFQVDYAADRSEMLTEEQFLYSNDTDRRIDHPEKLRKIAGCGSSPLVRYEGTGSYFLEKQEPGVWRLEVYPDAVTVNDPHGSPRLDREAVRLLYQTWPMQIKHPDLGNQFSIRPLNQGNACKGEANQGKFSIRPGVYQLIRKGAKASVTAKLESFFAPAEKLLLPAVVHAPMHEAIAGKPLRIEATVAATPLPETVTLRYRTSKDVPFRTLPMKRIRGYRYVVMLPGKELKNSIIEYQISAGTGATPPDAFYIKASAPGTEQGWATITLIPKSGNAIHIDFPVTSTEREYTIPFTEVRPGKGYIVLRIPKPDEPVQIAYSIDGKPATEKGLRFTLKQITRPVGGSIPIVARNSPVFLMKAERDQSETLMASKFGADGRYQLVGGSLPGTSALRIYSERFGNAADLSVRYLVDGRFDNRRPDFAQAKTLRIRARASVPGTDKVMVALLDRNGVAWGTTVAITSEWQDIAVSLSSLVPIAVARVPAGYPSSVVNALTTPENAGGTLSTVNIEAVQISLTGSLYGDTASNPKGIEIESIVLTK